MKLPVPAGGTPGTQFHAQPASTQLLLVGNGKDIVGRVRPSAVDSDAHVGNDGSVRSLYPVRGPGNQNHVTVRGENEALELHIAGSVTTGQVVRALLSEDEQGVDTLFVHALAPAVSALRRLLLACDDAWFVTGTCLFADGGESVMGGNCPMEAAGGNPWSAEGRGSRRRTFEGSESRRRIAPRRVVAQVVTTGE